MPNLPIFEKNWQCAKKDIFRLELLPEYVVEEDLAQFERWKRGEEHFGPAEREWLAFLENTKKRGVRMRRVRVVDLPFSDYVKFEIEFWQHSIKSGEEILFLSRNEYEKMRDKAYEDFWLFDDNILLIFHYGSKGEWVSEELVEDAELTKQHVNLKQRLLKHAIPMSEFLKHHPSS